MTPLLGCGEISLVGLEAASLVTHTLLAEPCILHNTYLCWGPFNRIGVDVIQFLRSRLGNQYAVVFVDHLTKWPEVLLVPDQAAITIANLLV